MRSGPPPRPALVVNRLFMQEFLAAERIFEILDSHNEVQERPGAVPLPRFAQRIEFRDVQFTYSGTAGYYRFQVYSYSGSGSYTLGYSNP